MSKDGGDLQVLRPATFRGPKTPGCFGRSEGPGRFLNMFGRFACILVQLFASVNIETNRKHDFYICTVFILTKYRRVILLGPGTTSCIDVHTLVHFFLTILPMICRRVKFRPLVGVKLVKQHLISQSLSS